MKRIISCVLSIMLCLGVFAYPLTVKAEGADDTTPPVLDSISIDKTSYTYGETMVVTIRAHDTESELDLANCYILIQAIDKTNPQHIGNINRWFGFSREKADRNGDEYKVRCGFGGMRTDDYKITHVVLQNTWGKKNEAAIEPPTIFHLENNDQTDWNGPVFDSLSADKSSVKPGDTVNFTMTAHDAEGSGLAYAGITLYPSNGMNQIMLYPVPGQVNKLKGSYTIPSGIPGGQYYVNSYMIADSLGNITNPYSGVQLNVFTVQNPGVTDWSYPTITNVTFSANTIKQGEEINISAQVDPKGYSLGDELSFPIVGTGNSLYQWITLKKQAGSSNIFTCSTTLPLNWPAGQYQPGAYTSIYVLDAHGNRTYTVFAPALYEALPKFTIQSVFSGVSNRTLQIGETFDPKAGVSAANSVEGDLTSKIKVTGDVDTSKPGLYLVKYSIKSDRVIVYESDNTYYDFCWVGVTEIMPENTGSGETPLALTNDPAQIGAESSDVSIQKDGNTISYTPEVSAAGNYDVSLSQSGLTGKSLTNAAFNRGEKALVLAAAGKKTTARLTIDKSGPVMSFSCKKLSDDSIRVSVQAKDIAGVAQIKWLKGSAKVSAFRTGGNIYNGSVIVSGIGNYSVYAKDKLGNERVTIFSLVDGKLCGINASAGTVSPAFQYKTLNYTLKLDEKTTAVKIAPIPANSKNVMTINGKKASSITVTGLENGKSKAIKVVVYDTKKKKTTYTINVVRDKSSDNTLKSLTLPKGFKLSPAFKNTVYAYKLTLPAKTSGITVSAKAQNKYAKVFFNGKKASSKRITLSKGKKTTLTITVQAQNGKKRTFKIIIERKM